MKKIIAGIGLLILASQAGWAADEEANKKILKDALVGAMTGAVAVEATKEDAVAALDSGGTIPANRRVLPYSEREELGNGSQKTAKWVVVESPAIVDGSELRNASATSGMSGDDYSIQFSLKKSGAAKFGAWTGANINEYLGVILNDEVKSIAFIKSQISDQGEISGRFTKQSAEDLALVLKTGALPAPVKLVAETIDKP